MNASKDKTQSKPENPSSKALEAAVPSLREKLMELKEGLNEHEQAILSSIVSSAALHLKSIAAIEPTANVQYMKPISAVASVGVRNGLMKLPSDLGFTKER